jgi:hypothetical protein
MQTEIKVNVAIKGGIMKVRMGFVSNSSSSSFLCIGVEDTDLIQELLKAENLL